MKDILTEICNGKRIPLIGFVEPLLYECYQRDDFMVSEEQAFQDAKACGLDIIVGAQYNLSKHPTIVERILQMCEKVGLYYLIRDNEGFKDKTEEQAEMYFKERYSRFLKYKSFGGINPTDEPGYSSWEKIRKFRRAFYRVFPDKLYFVNLLQNYAPSWALANGAENHGGLQPDNDYDFYCKSYVKQADPTVFCYDFYPFNGEYPNVQNGFFQQLETVFKYCSLAKVPIWCFLQSSAFPDMSGMRRAPTYEELLWQANTSLCYGTTGFAYFCYWIPVDDENWHGAFIDIRGNKEKTYDYGKKLNAYLRRIEPHVLGATVCQIQRAGQILESYSFPHRVCVEGEVITSLIEKDGTHSVLIANAGFEKTVTARILVGEEVSTLIDVLTGEIYAIVEGSLEVAIERGAAKLFKINK